jgi:hypothetical protein
MSEAKSKTKTTKAVVVGLHGAMGSGKDTAADLLQSLATSAGITRIARIQFAGVLRSSIEVLTKGRICASETRSTEQKARMIPDGCMGTTLGEFTNRILDAVDHAVRAGEHTSFFNQTKHTDVSNDVDILEAARRLTGVAFSRTDSDDLKVLTPNITIGRLLQLFGTEVGRQLVADDIWVRPVERQLEQAELAIVTDVRFPNELDFLKSRYALVYTIDAERRLLASSTDAASASAAPTATAPTTAASTAATASTTAASAAATAPTTAASAAAAAAAAAPTATAGRSKTHASETAMRDALPSKFAETIDNNTTLDVFETTIRQHVWPTVLQQLIAIPREK